MNNSPGAQGDANPSGEAPNDRTLPVKASRDADANESTLSSDAPHVVYNPPPASRADTARRKRALRRMTRQRRAPSWVKKIPWILFPFYGFMRLHDGDYENHYEQWQEQQRKEYGDP